MDRGPGEQVPQAHVLDELSFPQPGIDRGIVVYEPRVQLLEAAPFVGTAQVVVRVLAESV